MCSVGMRPPVLEGAMLAHRLEGRGVVLFALSFLALGAASIQQNLDLFYDVKGVYLYAPCLLIPKGSWLPAAT